MPFVLVTALNDLRRRLADVPALLIWMGLPVTIGILLFLVMGGSRATVPRAKVLLVDLDESGLSRLVGSAATSGRLGEFLDVERVALDEGQRRMAAGEASAMVVLPGGFGDALLNETPAELRLVTNPAQRLLPSIVQEGLEVLVEGVFYAQRVLGGPLRELAGVADSGPSDAQVTSIATGVNARLRALDGVAFPPVLSLEIGSVDTAAPSPNFGLLFVPGMLLMSVLFIAQGASGDLWREKQLGTLRRARALPVPVWHLLAGKVLATTALVAAIAAVGLVVVWLLFGAPAASLPLAWAWTCVAGAALVCYFFLLQVVTSSERGAQLVGSMVVFPLIMIGGCFFPFEVMPAWMAAVGKWTPNGLAVVRLREILDGRAAAWPLLASAAAIGLPAAGAFWLTARRLAGRFPVA